MFRVWMNLVSQARLYGCSIYSVFKSSQRMLGRGAVSPPFVIKGMFLQQAAIFAILWNIRLERGESLVTRETLWEEFGTWLNSTHPFRFPSPRTLVIFLYLSFFWILNWSPFCNLFLFLLFLLFWIHLDSFLLGLFFFVLPPYILSFVLNESSQSKGEKK